MTALSDRRGTLGVMNTAMPQKNFSEYHNITKKCQQIPQYFNTVAKLKVIPILLCM